MKNPWLFILFLLLFGLARLDAQTPLRNGKDYAVFFYVTTFQDARWSKLPDTKSEVEALAAELKNNYGFQTEIEGNLSRQQMWDKIAEVNSRSYGPNDQVLFFFSTHGYYEAQQKEGFLIPADGKANDPYGDSWIDYAGLGRRIAANKAGHLILALDACYSGAFGIRNAKNDKGGNITPPWESQEVDCAVKVQRAMKFKSRLYFSSGSKEQRTPGKSLFARRWLEVLRKGEELGVLRSEDLRYYLNKIEFPEPEDGSFTDHEDNGDFVFVHKKACGSEPTPPVLQPKTTDTDPDGDLLSAAQDECPDEFGSAKAKGCPDFDEDGIPNKRDNCPYEAGSADRNGCPPPADSDADGVPDASDKCRNTKGLPKYEGCPDTDGDLVPDHLDLCPNEKGKPAENGCPKAPPDLPNFVQIDSSSFQMGSNDGESIVKEPIRKGSVIVLEKIYYDFNSYFIRKGAARELDGIAQLMRQYPSMEIELIAHTDSRGTEEYNKELSLQRAESAMRYLKLKGISWSRIRAFGSGEAEIRNHCTEGVECTDEEHQFNRRIEVKVTRIEEPVKVQYGEGDPTGNR